MPDTKEKSIKEILESVLYNSTARACMKIFQTPYKLLKLILILFVSITGCLCAYLIVQSFFEYFNYEVITTQRTLYEIPMIFPKITICNVNTFTTEDAVHFLSRINNEINSEENIFTTDKLSHLSSNDKSELIALIDEIAIAKINSKNISNEERKKFGHDIKDILFKCKFNLQTCDETDFTWKFDRLLGNCFMFNAASEKSKMKESSISSSIHGLRMLFYVNFHQNLSLFNSQNGIGARVYIENSSYSMPFPDEINLPSGFKTSVSVERWFTFNLPKPYSNCDLDNYVDSSASFNSELFNFIEHSDYDYEQQ